MPLLTLDTSNNALATPTVLEPPRTRQDITVTVRLKNTTGGALTTFNYTFSDGISTEEVEPISLANNASVDVACVIDGDTLKRHAPTLYTFNITASGGTDVTATFEGQLFQAPRNTRRKQRR